MKRPTFVNPGTLPSHPQGWGPPMKPHEFSDNESAHGGHTFQQRHGFGKADEPGNREQVMFGRPQPRLSPGEQAMGVQVTDKSGGWHGSRKTPYTQH